MRTSKAISFFHRSSIGKLIPRACLGAVFFPSAVVVVGCHAARAPANGAGLAIDAEQGTTEQDAAPPLADDRDLPLIESNQPYSFPEDENLFRSGGPVDTTPPVSNPDPAALDEREARARGMVVGTVIEFTTQRPLPNRTVSASGQTTTTDALGRFTLAGIRTPYDLLIVEPDEASVSVYRGLSRRNPILVHQRSATAPRPPQVAAVSGSFSGGPSFPFFRRDMIALYFFSNEVDNYELLGGGLPSFHGPGYGPVLLRWYGGPLHGRLIALGTAGGLPGGRYVAWIADQTVVVAPREHPVVPLAFRRVKQEHVAGQVVGLPVESSITAILIFYRLPLVHASVSIGNGPSKSHFFDYSIPDLNELGELCVGAGASPGMFVTLRCGVQLGARDIVITMQPPPTLFSPADDALLDESAVFSWTPFDGGVHLLRLTSSGAGPANPSIDVYTSATTIRWRELSAMGLRFPRHGYYDVTAVGLGPYSSMDDAVGPKGLGDPFPVEVRRSYSVGRYVTTPP